MVRGIYTASRNANKITHEAAMDIDSDLSGQVRANAIVCTIGPKTQPVEQLCKLIEAGMDVVRLNFSHGSHEFHGLTIKNAREAGAKMNKVMAVGLDTKGPEVRTGKSASGGEYKIEAGSKVIVSANKDDYAKCSPELIYADYANLPKVVPVGGSIFIDDGLLNLKVEEVKGDRVVTTAVNSATLSDHKGVNLPNVEVDLPAISEKDAKDLAFGAEQDVDFVFASFIRKASDVEEVRKALGEKGQHIQIISKIENHEGVKKFAEILEASDGIMVARGDLGIEIPPEQVFMAQKMMISQCNRAGKPVICATQMLESMTFNPRPTRAEVSDVANAVLDGADCVMLSGETAKGDYPTEAVTMMAKICKQAQFATLEYQKFNEIKESQHVDSASQLHVGEVTCQTAVNCAYEIEAVAIVVLTNTGSTSRLIAKYRPRCPIYTVTTTERCARQAALNRSCIGVMGDDGADRSDYDARLKPGLDRILADGIGKSGEEVVAVHAYGESRGCANMVRVVKLP